MEGTAISETSDHRRDPRVGPLDDRTAVITVRGDLDWPTVAGPATGTSDMDRRSLLIDLRQVDHLGSSGTGALLRAWLAIDGRGGRMAVVTSSPAVATVLDAVRLDEVAAVLTSDEEVTAWLGAAA